MNSSKFIILSDIHGNLSAFQEVIRDFELKKYVFDGLVILGDSVNYGMRSNEVVDCLIDLEEKYPILVNLVGNHEHSILMGDTSRFSSPRGAEALRYTDSILTSRSRRYLENSQLEGKVVLKIHDKNILFIHGNLDDPYWGTLNHLNTNDANYSSFDYVVSGHSHIPHLIEQFYAVDSPEYRNKKRTVFLNPGSVGQPRNHNPKASYLYVDFENEIFYFNTVEYDVEKEQSLFGSELNNFYAKRLKLGV